MLVLVLVLVRAYRTAAHVRTCVSACTPSTRRAQEDGFTLPKLYVWDVEQDTLSYYNFETGMNEFDDCAARAAAIAATAAAAAGAGAGQTQGEQQRPETSASGEQKRPAPVPRGMSFVQSESKSPLQTADARATGSKSEMTDACAACGAMRLLHCIALHCSSHRWRT